MYVVLVPMAGRLDATELYPGHSLAIGGGGGGGGGGSSSSLPPHRGGAAPPFAPLLGPSALSARLQQFLPALERANVMLAARIATEGAASVDIEALPEGAAGHIEMNVALAELPAGARSGSSSESESDGGEGGAAGGARRHRRAPCIEELPDASGGGDSGGGGGGDGDGGSSESEGEAGSDEGGESLPAGKWITGAGLEQQREEIIRLLRGGGAAGAGGGGDAGELGGS